MGSFSGESVAEEAVGRERMVSSPNTNSKGKARHSLLVWNHVGEAGLDFLLSA